MRCTVLVDNHTFINHYFLGEPGACFYVQDGEEAILLDVGYSGVFWENAKRMNLDLHRVSKLVLSHGHNDHTGGLPVFLQHLEGVPVVAHPAVFGSRICEGEEIGCSVTREEVERVCPLILSREPVQVSEHCTFLGEIPQRFDFEARVPIGTRDPDGEADFVMDDSALACQTETGLLIITGCSHSGICNLVEHAKQVCGETRIAAIVGGFHLFRNSPRVEKTIAYLKENQVDALYPCHCTSFQVRAAIHNEIPVHEVGVGLVIDTSGTSGEDSRRCRRCGTERNLSAE